MRGGGKEAGRRRRRRRGKKAEKKKEDTAKGRSRYASAFRKPFERPTFESDWVMHVLFFLVPTYVN